jgi:hypothetical protein
MSAVERWEPVRNSWVDMVTPAADLARQIADTDFVPESMRRKPAAVAACILFGAELGIGPMQALAKVDVIKGRPAPRAELARALALAAGHEIWVTESTNTRVTVAGRRRDSENVQQVTWTLDDVRKAGIASPMYTKYPRQMLLARASAELVRLMCPDVLGGIGRFAEEMDDTDVEPAAAIETVAATSKRKRAALRPVAEIATPEQPPLPDEEPAAVETVTDAQLRKMMAQFGELGITDRDERLAVVEAVIGHSVGSSKELTKGEASTVVDYLDSLIAERADRPPLPDGVS